MCLLCFVFLSAATGFSTSSLRHLHASSYESAIMATEQIDEDLQSRQLAVYGRESMRKLRDAHILIVGLDGLGAEIAKNVILANVKAVTLCDATKARLSHLSAHFLLGPRRTSASRSRRRVLDAYKS